MSFTWKQILGIKKEEIDDNDDHNDNNDYDYNTDDDHDNINDIYGPCIECTGQH